MDTIVQRTRDKGTYLHESRYDRPKEVFKRLAELVQASGGLRSGQIACDVGCAAGEFLSYLRGQFPDATLRGYDVVPELVEKARQRVPAVTFEVGDVLNRHSIPAASADVCFLLGVLQIFDDVEPCLSNLLTWTRPGGRIYVFGPFNPYPYDVWVKYRPVDHPVPEHREPGWNLHSQISIGRYLDQSLRNGTYRFLPFEMPFDLPRKPDDLIRTWTFQDQAGRRHLTNGLCLWCHMAVLEIHRGEG